MGAARDRRATPVEPTREEVVAELLLFMRETVRELGEFRATGFLKKFYGWYLGRGRFPRPFKQELVMLPTIAEVETRLLAAAPGAAEVLERLEAELRPVDEVLLDRCRSRSTAAASRARACGARTVTESPLRLASSDTAALDSPTASWRAP